MFKLGIKSYFKNLPHLFTILGVIMFCLILAFCISIPYMVTTTRTVGENISNAIQKTYPTDVDKIINSFSDKIRALDWSKPVDALSKLLDVNWLLTTLKESVPHLDENWEILRTSLTDNFTTFTVALLASIILIAILFIVGIAGSIIVAKLVIDFQMKSNNNPIRYVFSFIIDVVLFSGIWALYLYCVVKTKITSYILLILVFVLMIFLYPFQNTLVYGRGKVKLKEVFTGKNILGLVLSTLIGFGISFLISFLCYKYFSKAFAIIIAAPLFLLTYLVCENASKNYVCEKYFEKNTEEKVIKKYNSQEKSTNN